MAASESPDGQFLYYTKEFDYYNAPEGISLWKLPVDGGEESEVLDSVAACLFEVVPEGIYFMQAPDGDEPDWAYSIRFLDFASGRVELVFQLPSKVRASGGLSVSPDRTSILYSQIDDQSSDLVLIEGFR